MEKVVQVSQDKLAQAQPQVESQANLVRNFNNRKPMNKQKYLLTLLSFLVIAAGALSGYFLAGTKASIGGGPSLVKTGSEKEEDQTTVEVADEEGLLKEEGLLVEGGIDGEGTHHLDREMGPEKYVYLTSVVLDLDNFVGKKVEIWGKAMSGQEAGYLMDVVKVQIK